MLNRLYEWYYNRLPAKGSFNTDNNAAVLSAYELNALKTLERQSIIISAVIGALGVLLLYLPQYTWPHYFTSTTIRAFSTTIQLPINALVYSVLLVFIEIVLLSWLHIGCVQRMALITGFATPENKNSHPFKNTVLDIGLEKKDKRQQEFGINPLEGANKKLVFLWNILLKLKATLSNMFMRFFVKRVGGRYAIQWVQDLAGIPVFAIWNAYGTYTVLNHGRIVLMGRYYIESFFKQINNSQLLDTANDSLVYDTLRYIAISKRDYHHNHYILTNLICKQKGLKHPGNNINSIQFLNALASADAATELVCKKIIVAGFLLDGKLSSREKKAWQLIEKNLSNMPTWHTLKLWQKECLQGNATSITNWLPVL